MSNAISRFLKRRREKRANRYRSGSGYAASRSYVIEDSSESYTLQPALLVPVDVTPVSDGGSTFISGGGDFGGGGATGSWTDTAPSSCDPSLSSYDSSSSYSSSDYCSPSSYDGGSSYSSSSYDSSSSYSSYDSSSSSSYDSGSSSSYDSGSW